MSKIVRNILIAVAVLLVLVAAAFFLYKANLSAAVEGGKTVTVEVVHGDGTDKEFVIQTDAETLRGALDQESLIDGTESEYGLYILTVDGETADESLQQWWSITQDGEMTMYGADEQVIADGEHYELTLVTGW